MEHCIILYEKHSFLKNVLKTDLFLSLIIHDLAFFLKSCLLRYNKNAKLYGDLMVSSYLNLNTSTGQALPCVRRI